MAQFLKVPVIISFKTTALDFLPNATSQKLSTI
jgi:hypothetical protein